MVTFEYRLGIICNFAGFDTYAKITDQTYYK